MQKHEDLLEKIVHKEASSKEKRSWRSTIFTAVMALLGMAIGVFFILHTKANTPIPREEAVAYVGQFESYEFSRNYCGIYFADGSYYEIYAHTQTDVFIETMESLEGGTTLYVLQNPNNQCVVEIKTDTQELLNFEESQKAIDEYDNGYVILGVVACVAGALLLLYAFAEMAHKRKETRTKRVPKASPAARQADFGVKSRTLLEVKLPGYVICYRRVKSVNELIVNERVYDEKKSILEFAHALVAEVDGHKIEAGLDEDSYSYIEVDGERIATKRRIV